MSRSNAGDSARRRVLIRALSIGLSTTPFGFAFGVIASNQGLTLAETIGFSSIVFTGSAQFAAVAILGEGGAIVSAVLAGLLLNLRSLAFGILLAPDLSGPRWWRALAAQLVIDESTAVATAEEETSLRRFGFLTGGLAVFVLWNLSTVIGAVGLETAGDVVDRWGLDATIPAAFLALLWPRLSDLSQRRIAAIAAVVAMALTPIAPPGIPVVASIAAILSVRNRG
jgi:predicted branched-subunit amino acid permease